MSPCDLLLDGSGNIRGFRCGRERRRVYCAYCNEYGLKLCDGPGADPGKTCDIPLCVDHASPGGHNIDYCPKHKALAGNVVKLPIKGE